MTQLTPPFTATKPLIFSPLHFIRLLHTTAAFTSVEISFCPFAPAWDIWKYSGFVSAPNARLFEPVCAVKYQYISLSLAYTQA